MTPPQQDTCSYCKEPLKQITKHLKDGTQTSTKTKVCVNPECPLSVKIEQIKTWK